MNSSKKRTAFTLIELLVVISIIALLLSILMPSLGKAKAQAQAIVCRVNLKSATFALLLYTEDNKGYFNPPWGARRRDGSSITDINEMAERTMWHYLAAPYYDDPKALMCPTASIPVYSDRSWYGHNRNAWSLRGEGGWGPPLPITGQRLLSSFSVNDWCSYDPGRSAAGDTSPPLGWEKISEARGDLSKIPLLMDGAWYSIAPWDTARPPLDSEDKVQTRGAQDSLDRVCLQRHRNGINIAFMDFSSRKVTLKELWQLRWSKGFDYRRNPFADPKSTSWAPYKWIQKISQD